jgi:hypothetical protein
MVSLTVTNRMELLTGVKSRYRLSLGRKHYIKVEVTDRYKHWLIIGTTRFEKC